MKQTPQQAAEAVMASPSLPLGDDERFTGYGVMGLPFSSGHYLAFRCWPRTSIGPGYRAVWHRDPGGRWTFYATEPPQRSCARYLSAATASEPVTCPVDASWTGPASLHVAIPDVLSWDIDIRATGATRLMTASAAAMPGAAWNSRLVMRAMGHVAGPVLRAGRVRLTGHMPNGQDFRAAPLQVWAVPASRAILHGADAGPVGPLSRQDTLGDFWMPQRGVFAVGRSRFEAHDPARHHPLPASPGASVADQAVIRGEQAR